MSTTAADQGHELTRLEILRAYKLHLARKEGVNVSPFTEDRVVRYHTNVEDCDIADIHQQVRTLVRGTIQAIHQEQPSQIVILAGAAGMGKSHLINYFRSPRRANELGYVLVCNSNHWKADEFERCLLDWILNALVRPASEGPERHGPDLLLEKIQELAFLVLGEILSRPGQIAQFRATRASSFVRRLWDQLFGQQHSLFHQFCERRDCAVFPLLHFPKFASYVCDRFLLESGNPFHRYVMHVLLRYLFEEDREAVRHWLRRVRVPKEFLHKLGALDEIDCNYKLLDTIKILISLYTPDIARNLSAGSATPCQGRVFFFAFDQMEGRQELFENDADWGKFFAHVSELYNALPNVFILFTMTLHQRNKLHPQMEKQFRDRIRGDQRFILDIIADQEILALYQRRVAHWLGEEQAGVSAKTVEAPFRFLPFSQEQILAFSRGKTLRETLTVLDEQFCDYLNTHVVLTDAKYEILVARNQMHEEEQNAKSFQYTANHLQTVNQLLHSAGQRLATMAGLSLAETEWKATKDKVPVLWMEFRDPKSPSRWVRVFLVRLPFMYKHLEEGCVRLLHNLQTKRNFLWLVRPDRIDPAVEELKRPQVIARQLAPTAHTTFRAILQLLGKKELYTHEDWARAEEVMFAEVKLTYLGELFQQVRDALELQQDEQGEDEAGVNFHGIVPPTELAVPNEARADTAD